MPGHVFPDSSILEAAILGLEYQKTDIDQKITEIRKLLRRDFPAGAPVAAIHQKRTRSAATRKRMAAAQRRRWAESKKANEVPAKKPALSDAGRRRIAEASRKRWAAFRAKKAAVTMAAKKAPSKKH